MQKTKTSILSSFLVIIGFCFLSACSEEEKKSLTKQEIIEIKIEEKLKRWQAAILKKCTSDVLETAEAIVDSTLIAQARLSVDSITKPAKPIKPLKPEVKEANDTLPIAPLFDTLPAQ